MAIYDDKTLDVIKAGDRENCFIISNVSSHSEAIFKASYIVASSLRVSGKITALFDLIVLGAVEAEDIDVKGKFICIGDCSVENSIIVQDKMFVKSVKAKNIEVHDQIIAQEIEVDEIRADGNIMVGQTLATEKLAFSDQNIMCGETAYGAGRIAANSIITVEPLDMDEGDAAVVESNIIAHNIKQESNHLDINLNFLTNNDYESYLLELLNNADECLTNKFIRWERCLNETKDIIENCESICLDLGLLLTLTEIVYSSYFKDWELIASWWKKILNNFNSIANGELIDKQNKMSESDFIVNKRVVHKKFGVGTITNLSYSGGTLVTVLFDSGERILFRLDMAMDFFSFEKGPNYLNEDIKAKLFLDPIDYNEWISFVSVVENNGHMFCANLINILNDLLYAKIGLKSKFIADRLKENGWNK